jgi:hypothetical protein
MDCPEAREHILDSLTERRADVPGDLAHHLAGCDDCRAFDETQRKLDSQLSIAISAPPLNPRFRRSLMKRARRESRYIWPEFLPDKAHLAGCVCATALSIPILPFSSASIITAGLAVTLVTYFLQSAIRATLEILDEGQQ